MSKYPTNLYPWSSQSQHFPYGPGLFDNTHAVKHYRDIPVVRPIPAMDVFRNQSDKFITPQDHMFPWPDPSFVAPYIPIIRETGSIPRAATVSSDQFIGRPLGWSPETDEKHAQKRALHYYL